MRFTCLTAGLLACAALASSARAQSNHPPVRPATPSETADMMSLTGRWITNSGAEIELFTSHNGNAITARMAKPASDGFGEAFIVQPYEFGRFAGNYERVNNAAQSKDLGSITVTHLSHGSINGVKYPTGNAPPIGFGACSADKKPVGESFLSGRYWLALDNHQKRPDGSYIVTASLLNISGQDQGVGFDDLMTLDGQTPKLASATPRQEGGGVFHEVPQLRPCQSVKLSWVFDAPPSGVQKASFRTATGPVISWDVASDFARPRSGQETGPSTPTPPPPPPPPPSPPPPPPPVSTPPEQPSPAPSPGTGSTHMGGIGGWQRYGIWSFKVDELGPEADGVWQAVVSVRSETRDKVGMTASELDAYLINADGESIPEAGNLYKASVTGIAPALEKLSGTQWMQQGDVIRVRLLFEGSAKFRPVKLRVRDAGAPPTIRNFPLH